MGECFFLHLKKKFLSFYLKEAHYPTYKSTLGHTVFSVCTFSGQSVLVTAEKGACKCNLHCVTHQLDSFSFQEHTAVCTCSQFMMCLPTH